MKEFTFDLQRFEDDTNPDTVNDFDELKNAIKDAKDGDTIKFTADISAEETLPIPAGKNITIDLDSHTFTTSDTITVKQQTTVTFKGGKIDAQNPKNPPQPILLNQGTLTLEDMTVDAGGITSNTNIGEVNVTGKSSLQLNSSSGYDVSYKFGAESNKVSIIPQSTLTLTTAADGSATISIVSGNSSYSFTDNTDQSNKTTYTALAAENPEGATETNKGYVTFSYDTSGNLSVTNLLTGRKFSVTNEETNSTVTYTVNPNTGSGLTATYSDGTVKVWTGENPINQNTTLNVEDDLVDDNFTKALPISDNKLEISTDVLPSMKSNESIIVVSSSNYGTFYGTLTKVNNTTYKLAKEEGTTYSSLSGGITIGSGLTVQLGKEFINIPITVNSTTLKTTSSEDTGFTVTSDSQVLGGKNISLGSGTLLMTVDAQTISAGSYEVSDYKGNSIKDGVTIAKSSDAVIIGGIDTGETITVNEEIYYRDQYGIRNKAGQLYTGDVTVSAYGNKSFSIDASNLADNFRSFITPEGGVLTVGGENSLPAVVISGNSSDDIKRFGELKVNTGTGDYTLTSVNGAEVSAFETEISTISVVGADTTIYKELGNGKTIVTGGGATFKVTAVSGDYFTVNGQSDTPTVNKATALTLINGKIATDTSVNQTITLGSTGKTVVVASESNSITVSATTTGTDDSATTTATITAAAGDTFTLDGKAYTVDSNSDGMTLTVDKDGKVTISDLDTTGKDIFTIGDATYYVRGAGFIKQDSSGYSIWTPSDNKNLHSLTSGTVTVDSLTSSDNWQAVVTISSSTDSATLPPSSSFTGTAYLVDSTGFADIYGTFTKDGDVYKIEPVDATGNLASISFDSGTLSMGAGLTNVSIVSGVASLAVTSDSDSDGYTLTLTGSAASLSGGDKVSLYNGALQADSTFAVTVAESVVTVLKDATVTVTADGKDATISGLDSGESLTVQDKGTYEQTSVVGLIDGEGKYLFGSAGGTVTLSDINDTTRWGDLVVAGEFVIKDTTDNALVVNNAGNPQTLYADYEAGKSLLSQSNGGYPWPTNTAVSIDNTTVTLTADFANVTIYGVKSKAEFTVTDDNQFTVTDAEQTGASIDNAKNINLAGGTLAPTSLQTVNTQNGTVTAAQNVLVIVDGENTSIGSIGEKDAFTVDNLKYTREIVGLMDANNKLWTGNAFTDQIAVNDLQNETNWTATVTLESGDGQLAVPPSSTDDTITKWRIIDSGKTAEYGTLTSSAGAYTIAKADDKEFSIRATFSGAIFTTDATTFTVTDDSSGATVSPEAATITQTAGIIALTDKTQQIIAAGNTISVVEGEIKVSVSIGNTVTITSLDAGDKFTVLDSSGNEQTYELLDNGKLSRNDGKEIWSGADITDSVTTAALLNENNWNSLAEIEVPDEGESTLTIDAAAVSVLSKEGAKLNKAFVVKEGDNKTIYGTLTKNDDDTYTLSATGTTDSLSAVVVTADVPTVEFTKDFVDLPISAGSTATFKVTDPNSNTFTVNYDGTTAYVDSAPAIELTSGTLTTDNTTNQVITVGDNTVKAAAGTVTVALKDNTVTVDSIDEANDSVIVKGKTYTLTDTAGGGFKININSNGTTTLSDVGNGDKFKIGTQEFYKTSAGFFRTDDNGTDYAYMWTNETDTDVNGVDVDRLTGSDDWTAIVDKYEDGVLTIDTNSNAGILVDNVTAPTAIYGKLISESNNTFKLEQYASTYTKLDSIKIYTVTVTVADEFNATPITAVNGATVKTSDPEDTSKHLTFSPESDTFTVNSTAYEMTDAGLTDTTNKKIWTTGGATKYVLPANTWTPYLKLNSSGKLDFATQTATEGDNVIVDNTSTNRYAKLAYTAATDDAAQIYDFTAIDGAGGTIATIALGDAVATVTTDFNTTVVTGDSVYGTYSVNGKEYTYSTGNTLTIAATINVNVKSSTLTDGTVTIEAGKEVTANATIACTTANNGITATASGGEWQQLGSLDKDDTFTVGDNTYKVFGGGTIVQIDGMGDIIALCKNSAADGKIAYKDFIGSFDSIFPLTLENSEKVLDLTGTPSIETAVVVGLDDEGEIDPTKKVAALEYASNAYTLTTTSGGDPTLMDYVKLGGTARTLTIEGIDATVKTDGSINTFIVNGKSFSAQDELTIATDQSSSETAFLTGGTVSVATNASVTTRRTVDTVTLKEEITATKGTLLVNVENDEVTLREIRNDNTFSVTADSTKTDYHVTSIGFTKENDNKIFLAYDTSSVKTDELNAGDWLNVVTAENGALTIDSNTMTANGDALVVYLTDATDAKRYGTLTKSGSDYTLDTTKKADDLLSITVNGVKATFASAYKDTRITAGDGTFTVETTAETFIVDMSGTLPRFTDVDTITLTAGSLVASSDVNTPTIVIGNNGYDVKVNKGTMTVGFNEEGTKAQISGLLEEGDTFTVGVDEYTVTGSKLRKNDKEDVEESHFKDGVFTIDESIAGKIIAVKGTTLDLTEQMEKAFVYNEAKNERLATLEVSNSGVLTLTLEDGISEDLIKTVIVAPETQIFTEFKTQVKTSEAGTVTVNGVSYNGTDALIIDSNSDGTSSTLYTGTVTLNNSYPSVTATNYASNVLEYKGGDSITATASKGDLKQIGELTAGDTFTYKDKTYTKSDCGIVKGDTINEKLNTDTVSISKLTENSDNWTKIIAPDTGELNLKTLDSDLTSAVVYDNTDLPTKRLATLKINDTTLTLKADSDALEEDSTIAEIDTVDIATGKTLTVNFVTQVETSEKGEVTVNNRTYSGTKALTIDSDGKDSTLYDGTVTISETYNSVTATNDSSALKWKSGDFTATAESGNLTEIKDFGDDDAFTWNGDTYTYSTQGLLNKAGQICESLKGSTVDLTTLSPDNFVDFLAPNDSGLLNLKGTLSTGNISVFDSKSAPTKKLATLTVGSDKLTLEAGTDATDIKTVSVAAGANIEVNFVTQVKAPAQSTVTVNGNEYTAVNALTIKTTADDSTLANGTVTLAKGSSVTPTGEEKITATAGDGLTVKVASGDPVTVTISGITDGDSFTVGDDTSFTMNDGALYRTVNSDEPLVYLGTIAASGITLDTLTDTADSDWGFILEVTDGALVIEATMDKLTTTGTNARLVDKNLNVYGTLIKTYDGYTLTADNATEGTTLNSITVVDTKVVTAADFASVPLTLGSSKFSDLKTTNDTYTVDDTDDTTDTPTISADVTSLTLDSGTVKGVVNQTVKAGDYTVKPTAGDSMIISATKITGLATGNAFTLGGDSYSVIDSVGLYNSTDKTLADSYSSGTFTFGDSETQVIAPESDGTINISTVTEKAVVVDSTVTAPTTKLGTVTLSGTNNYTVELTQARQVTTPTTAPVTVNGATFNGSSLTLNVADTSTTPTLTQGTVTLLKDAYVTPTGNNKITATKGDGLTVDVVNGIVTFGKLNSGDEFTVDTATYKVTDAALTRVADNQIYTGDIDVLGTGSITLTELNGNEWSTLLPVTSGVVEITSSTLTAAGYALFGTADLSVVYGKLTRNDDGTYALAQYQSSTLPTTIKVTGTTVELAPAFKDVELVANGTELSELTLGNTQNNYTVDATDTVPTLSDNVTAFTLGQGSVTVNENQTVTTGDNVLTATAGSVTVNATIISDIDTGDTFTLNGKAYMLMDSAGLFNVTDSALVDDYADGSAPFGSSETQVVAPVNGVVQLADVTEAEAIVLSDKTTSATKLGTVTVNGTNDYTVELTQARQVTTPTTSPVTVNGATYNGSSLTLNTTADSSTLTEGTVTLANAESVTTTTGNTITATEGDGLTVTAASSTVTLGALNSGDIFTVDGTEYKVTDAALYRLVDKEEEIYNGTADVLGEGTITVAQLAEDVWGGISSVEDDTIVIDDKTLSNGESTKLTNEDGSKVYGELSRDADGKYTLTKTDDTTDSPTGITINEVTAAIDSDFASVPVTTVNADDSKTTFTATPTKNAETFTVDATGNAPALTDVKAVELTEGALAAEVNQPVTLDDGKVVTPTKGTMTINSDGVSDLAAGDAFTVDGDTYKVIDGVGLFNATDKTLVDDFTDTFNFGATETQILAPNSSGQVDLSAMSDTTAQVFDSDTAPTTKLGTVTLNDNAYTVDFVTPLKLSAGTFSVNGKDYTATSDVVIQSDGKTSTLTQGTVSLAVDDTVTTTTSGTVIKAVATAEITADEESAIDEVAADEDSSEVITVTVNADGSISIGDLGAGDIFTVNGKQYKFATAGLLNPDGDIWTGEDFTDSLTLTALENADNWTETLEVTDGNLAIDTETLAADGEVILVDDADDPTVTYGALVKDSDTYTLATDDTSATLNAIAIDNTTMNIDGALASVPVTANENATFTVTPNKTKQTFTVDATTEAPALTDNVKAVTLTAGTVTAAVKQPVTIGDSTITPATINGTMTIGMDSIGGLTADDEFTIDGDTYKVIDGVGLFNATDKTLADTYADGSMTIGGSETQILTPNSNGQIELSKVTGTKALVFNSDTAPKTKLGTVTKADSVYTIDYAAQVVTPSTESVTVNGATYNGSSLTLDTTATTSTLTAGTVTIAAGSSVTPTGKDTVTVTSGDGLTVKVSGSTVTISGMNDGDTFTVGEAAYKITAAGPINGDNKIWTGSKDYTDGLTTTDLATAENWTEMLSAPDGALTVKPSTLAEGDTVIVVDNTKNPTKTYGALTKDSIGYTLTKGDEDETLSSLTDSGTVIDVDNDLAKVPVTTVVSDGSEATFTVTPAGGTDYFTVDATGTTPAVDNAGSVEVSKGKITAGDGIPVTAADGAEDVDISAGDGTHDVGNKTVKVDGMGTDEEGNKNTVDFGTDSDGNLNSVSGLKEGATVTVDGHTYTAPFDDATLKYNDNDGWYFDDYELEEYTVTVDSAGNVSVDEGVQFSKVVASSKTLDTSGTVKFAANITKTPITVINKGATGLNISDYTGDKLAANLGMTDGVKFSGDTTEIESLSDVAGATFTLDRDQSLTGEDATITGGADDTEVLVASRGKFLNIDKAATVNAPAATELLLGNATYNLNGVALTTGDSTEASLTSDGVTVDLAGNDPLTFNGMTLGTSGTATFDTSGNVSLTSGATATNANGNTLTIDGTVAIDDKTVTVAEATKVTATASGLNVGDDTLTVTGDEDGYIINIASSAVIGLADIGSSTGVTVNGLDDATVATDKASSLTVDKTFSSPAEVTYTVADGKLVGVTNAESISGDFSGGFNVNGTNYTVKGGTATVNTSGNIETGAGTYGINGHTFTTSQPTTFTMNNASVTGASLEGDGNFAVHQDEMSFNIDGSTLTFSDNDNPVTVGTASGIVTTAQGVNGLIDGLTDATVYDVSTATINGTPIGISGGVVDVPVVNGVISTILGLDAGATVNSAPNLTLTAAENGTFTFVDDSYNVNDTVDGSVDFITDSNSRVININGLSGLLSGSVDDVTLNGQPFVSTSDDVTLATDGTNITAVLGLSSGDIIAGSLSKATMTLPEGSVTINGAPFTLAGDSNGVELSGDGTVISGLAKDSTLTVGAADTYNINGTDFAATAGQAYTVNREGVYPINASIMPITETTAAEDILALGASSIYIAPSVTGSQSVAFSDGNNVALIDSADAPTSVKTGTGTDSVIARHGAQATVDVEDGTPIIVATKGKVTLDNYNDNADIQTFDYTDIPAAVMNNDIKFGDGTMTLGDAVISFGTSAASTGATLTDIIGATGDKQAVGFTHTNGGTLDTRSSSDNFILKGNYAQNSTDTQKGDGSSIAAGSGNDTVLVGAEDTVDAGGGANQIYITDPSLRGAGATIALTSGTNTVHGFNPGFTATSDAIKINDLAALEIGFGNSGLTMASGNAQLMFDGMAAPTVTVAATSDSLNPAAPYELKLTDGTTTYNAAIAQDGKDLAVVNGTTADVFIGADNTGLSFNEYTGAVAVNLGDNAGTLDSSAAQIYGVDKVALGSGNGTLIGAENTNNTLIAGTGNGSIWSDSGNDLMRGNTSADKKGSTAFFYAGGDGKDTIDGFDFMASADDTSADEVVILPDARVTAVNLSGDDVVIGFNDGTDDLLTITNAKDTPFRVNGLITKVDDDVVFDGFTECYVGSGDRPTLTVGQGMGEVDIFLGDDEGTEYLGDIAVLDASAANGEMNFLAGSDTDNLIIGGSGENAIWGGDSFSNDTLVGGSGKNTFFFAAENGNDVIQNAHDGDVVDLTYLDAEQFSAVEVTSDGVAIDLTDGSHLDVQSNAAVEYKLGDGNTYLVDHDAGEFNRKEN